MAVRRPLSFLLVLVALGLLAAPLAAQTISIRTIPVATGDQFLVHPSRNLGMGGSRWHWTTPG